MDTGLYFSCEIGGLGKSTFDVVDFTLEEALSTLYSLEVLVASRDEGIDADAQLLKSAKFIVYVDGEVQRTVNGIVSEMYRGDSGHRRTYYTLLIRPTLWLMTLTQDNRIFHFKSIPEILDELLLKHNINADKKLRDEHKQWEYTTQRNETDYDFFCRMAAEEGIAFWFEEEQLFYADSRLGMMAGPKLSYNTHIQSVCREQVIHSLRYGAKMTPNAVHLKDYYFPNPDVEMSAKDKRVKKRPTFTIYESYGRYDDKQVADNYTTYRLEAQLVNSASGQAQSNCIKLIPGRMFVIADHPTTSMNDNWQLVSIVHRGSLPQSVAEEAGDETASLSNQFHFIPSETNWRPQVPNKPTVFGDETATVVGPAGEEIYTNEYGEVKIHFHWNQYDEADEKASCWVRTGQGWNGDGFGIMAIPRIGQEVLIAYLNGDIDRPIIVGTVYNGKNDPPMRLPANKTQTTIRTKTHKGEGFNELRFEDEQGRQEVFIHAQKDMNTKVLNDRSTHVLNDHSENVDGHQTVTVKKTQTIDVLQHETETVGGNQTLLVKQNQKETVVMTKAETIGIAKALTIGSVYQTTVGMAMNTSVGISQSTQVGLTKSLLVGQTYTVDIGRTVNYTVGQQKTETVGKVSVYSAGDHLELICGKAKIVLTKDGGIFLKGEHIELQANQAVNADANLMQLNCGATQAAPEAPECDEEEAEK